MFSLVSILSPRFLTSIIPYFPPFCKKTKPLFKDFVFSLKSLSSGFFFLSERYSVPCDLLRNESRGSLSGINYAMRQRHSSFAGNHVCKYTHAHSHSALSLTKFLLAEQSQGGRARPRLNGDEGSARSEKSRSVGREPDDRPRRL